MTRRWRPAPVLGQNDDQQRTKLAAVKVTGEDVALVGPHLPVSALDGAAAEARLAGSTPASPQHINEHSTATAVARLYNGYAL